MSTSRRHFLRAGTAAALFAGLSFSPFKAAFGQTTPGSTANNQNFQIPQEAMRDRVFYFTKSTFEPHLNTNFTVHAGVIATTLSLVEVSDCGSRTTAAQGAGECISLIFHANRKLSDLQTIHTFEHGALGEFKLYVTKVGKDDERDTIRYEAVINHRTEPDAAPSNARPSVRVVPRG